MVIATYILLALFIFIVMAFLERALLDCSDYASACFDDFFAFSFDLSSGKAGI